MKRRLYILLSLLFVFTSHTLTAKNRRFFDVDSTFLQTDSLNSQFGSCPIYTFTFLTQDGKLINDSTLRVKLDSLIKSQISYSDSLLFQTNELLIPLVFFPKYPVVSDTKICDNLRLFPTIRDSVLFEKPKEAPSIADFVIKLRSDLRNEITNKHASWYHITSEDLPQPESYKQYLIHQRAIDYVSVSHKLPEYNKERIKISEIEKRYWRQKANALFQFSQNYISSNWYQGGNSNLALLSVINGQLVYDNLDNIQWENNVEWRAGFNSVEGDTLRKVATNDDLLRYTTKFGVKAFGNWYYSISGEASTQLFDNYKAINSTVFKARFLTPVRVNLGLGMDYKYKKIFSLMVAPFTFKYIYANDTTKVNPNLFGITKGENHLSEIGSSFKAQISYSPMDNWQIDSRLTFFTNYKKVETDWEIVNNFNFNRYISARLMLNPRYDNTVIQKTGEKAGLQFKQLLSVGLSLRLI